MTYSVAIPAYNAAKTIAEAIKSVLAQTVPPSDIVVVDDGSTDDTAAIARAQSDTVKVITQDNAGCGQATSRAIKRTMCDIVATLDADDLWMADKMEKQLEILRQANKQTLVFGSHRHFKHGSDDYTTGHECDGKTRSDLVLYRAAFDHVGDIFDPPGGRGDMVDWLGRARELGYQFQVCNAVLVLRRIIPGSLSYGRDNAKDQGYLMVAHRAMMRRKAREQAESTS
ncbi:glycosyltransferase family 2 protein [Thioclava sp. 15-R06ZXC-3]|uniref:Glycosyltransferase family 2 protein n=1 Tax=Thioclava arctica TaxID=3238301 RepID=A0ABV3TR45_9RHOB